MPDFEVTTKEHGKVAVTLDDAPKDAGALREAIAGKIMLGQFTKAGGGTGLSALYQGLAEPATRGVASVLETIGSNPLSRVLGVKAAPGYPPDVLSEKAGAAARNIVPQTLPGALGLAGTIAGAMASGGTSLPAQAAARVGGAFLGGAGGGLLEGQSPMEALGEAGTQGGAAALAEIGGFLLGKGARGLAGAQKAQNRKDTQNVVAWLREQNPALADFIPEEPSKLKLFVQSGQMRRGLGDIYDSALKDVNDQIGRAQIRVPSLSPNPMSFLEAARNLREIGQKGYSGAADNPLTRTMTGLEARRLRETVLGEIEGQLNRFNPSGEAAQAFTEARHRWALGHFGDEILRKNAAFHGLPNDVRLNMNNIRSMFEGTKLAKLVQDLDVTGDELQGIMQALYRAGTFGGRDLLTSAGGRFGSHLAQMARGTATGSVNAPLAPLRLFFAGLGDEYTGQAAPRALAPVAQTGLDALLQAVGGSPLNPLGLK